MRVGQWAAAAAAAVLAAGFAIVGPSPASANQVWHQEVERSSADAGCPMNSGAESAAGWSEWGASWAQWANGGSGGWVCERSITWAKDSGAPHPSGIGCVEYGGGEWAQFGGNWFMPAGSAAYVDAYCTVQNGVFTDAAVYAPPGFNALDLCREIAPATQSVDGGPYVAPDVYECLPYT